MDDRAASRTAVLVCQGRAVASGRLATEQFRDDAAAQLLTVAEREAVDRARLDVPPAGTAERLSWERLRACAEGMVPRTIMIDDAIRVANNPQLVIVGAGLDTRPWRLHELADSVVFAVDQPASQEDCRRRAVGLTPSAARLEFVPVDLVDAPLGPALDRAGHDPAVATTWVLEGVAPYLTRDAVETTVDAIGRRCAAGSAVVVQYQDRSVVARVGRRISAFVARRTGVDDPLASEPWRSLWKPAAMADALAAAGLAVEQDSDLLATAHRIGMLVAHARSLANGRVAIAVPSVR
jgi:methyltransferase (TIGR00027 family)